MLDSAHKFSSCTRDYNITISYLATRPEIKLPQIAQIYSKGQPMSNDWINRIIPTTFKRLWIYTPYHVQEKYELPVIPYYKPIHSHHNSDKLATLPLRQQEAAKLIMEGFSWRQAALMLNIPTGQVWRAMYILNYTPEPLGKVYPSTSECKNILQSPNVTDLEKKVVFESINYGKATKLAQEKPPLLISIQNTCRYANLKMDPREIEDIFNLLKSKGLPIGRYEHQVKSGKSAGLNQVYYFISTADLQRALELLK
jgi:hypothetical protein